MSGINQISLLLSLFQGSSTSALTGSSSSSGAGFLDILNSVMPGAATNSPGSASGLPDGSLSASGRKLSLFDPESAFRMMTDINQREVSYQGEFSEMTDMQAWVSQMQSAGQSLAGVDAGASDTDIRTKLAGFVEIYNQWIDRFDEALAKGGLLNGTQAASVAQWELEQSIENPFTGAVDRIRGMTALGVSIDPQTNVATLDSAKLDAALADHKDAVIRTIEAFGTHFAKSAELLNSANNFIPNRLDNLSRAIDYIGSNRSDLQAEFGTGDAARPEGALAQALASYRAMQGTKS